MGLTASRGLLTAFDCVSRWYFGCFCCFLPTQQHDRLKREDNDLVATVPITLKDALTGCAGTVTGIDGKTLSWDCSKEVVSPNTRKRIKGEGMPRRISGTVAGRGDLIVKFDIAFPEKQLSASAVASLLSA